MRRTIITPSRFLTSTPNWWANFRSLTGFLAFLVLLSCEDNTGAVGFRNPNSDFQVFDKEFVIPTKVFQMDSVSTSNLSSDVDKRVLVGSMTDPKFGKTTASAYMQYWAAGYPSVTNTNAVFERITLTLMFDYYWQGSQGVSQQTYQVYEMADSLLTYLPHYSNQSMPLGSLLGEANRTVSTDDFDQNVIDNGDGDTSNDIQDSLNVDLDDNFGRKLLAYSMDTVGTNELNYEVFYYFRKIFKGLAIVASESDKIVGFDPEDAKSRMTMYYHIDSAGDPAHRKEYKLNYYFAPSGQPLPGTSYVPPEYLTYTEIKNDRSGTALAALPPKYTDFEPADGLRYIQAGTGLAVKLDLTEVRDHFKNVPVKALSVAEVRIETDQQPGAIRSFLLRALRPDNRNKLAIIGDVDGAADPISVIDYALAAKHAIYGNSLARLEPIGDGGTSTFSLAQLTNENGKAVYIGYLTNFLQKETTLSDDDFLRYYALVPQSPDNAKGVNGFYFPSDKIKLKIYYTTPGVKQ